MTQETLSPKNFSILKKANELFREGKYEEALELYERIVMLSPKVFKSIEFNISLTKKHTSSPRNIYLPNKNKTENLIISNYYDSTEAYNWVDELCIRDFSEPYGKTLKGLVSVVMPVRNGEEYIYSSILSLLKQSYNNLEIIVVDDFSTDRTGKIVTELSSKDSRIRYVRVNSNLGTYFARSYGVFISKGEFITFQDADDYSHHKRIELHLSCALKNNSSVVTSNYIRFDLSTGKVIKFHGREQHYGFITTFAKRHVFEDIGSFDLTSRGGDAEFSKRLTRFFEKRLIKHLPIPTYLATDRPGSLSHNEINRTESNTTSALSFPRAKYNSNFNTILQTFEKKQLNEIFRFPMIRSPYNLPKRLDSAKTKSFKFIGCVCTIPERQEIFKKVFPSIESQVDILYVYPDKYLEHEIPEYILKSKKVIILSTTDHPGLRDGAKFLPLQLGLFDEAIDKTIVFTFDDDIQYPPDYTLSLFNRLSRLDYTAVVGVHGVIMKPNFQNYRSDRIVYNFKHSLENDTLVDVLGTGTVAFRADLLRKRFTPSDINPGFIDISLAAVCRKSYVPLYAVKRPAGWLIDLTASEDMPSLWNELVQDSTPHTQVLKHIGTERWGEEFIKEIYINRNIEVDEETHKKSYSFNIRSTEKNPAWIFKFSLCAVYRITIKIENLKEDQGKILLRNANNFGLLFDKNVVKGHASFLCNAAINKNVVIEAHEVFSHLDNYETSIFIEKIFDASMPRLNKHEDKTITACLATYPPREDCLNDVIQSVLPQVDNFCIYLNRYNSPPKSVLDLVDDPEKSTGLDYIVDYTGMPKASGKFRWIDREGYIFTIDDDILYPTDYFQHLIGWIEKYKRKAFVGVHGVLFKENVSSFHKEGGSSISEKINFSSGLETPKRVHMIGTGTLAFHSSLISDFKEEMFDLLNYRVGYENANDECLAVFCNKRNIPMYIIPRQLDWLKSNKKMKYGIYEEHFNDEELATSVLELLMSGNPWPVHES